MKTPFASIVAISDKSQKSIGMSFVDAKCSGVDLIEQIRSMVAEPQRDQVQLVKFSAATKREALS